MADERHEYEALVTITDPAMGRPAYLAGQPIHAQVVEDWGLRIGAADDEDAQVLSLRPNEMARPAANATRDDWLRYRLGQPGADREALEQMGRNQLRDMDAPDEPPGDEAPAEPAGEEEE